MDTELAKAKKIIRDNDAGLIAWTYASFVLVKPGFKAQVTFQDLLTCLQRGGSCASAASVELYVRTGRPGGNELATYSSDYSDWKDYLEQNGFLE